MSANGQQLPGTEEAKTGGGTPATAARPASAMGGTILAGILLVLAAYEEGGGCLAFAAAAVAVLAVMAVSQVCLAAMRPAAWAAYQSALAALRDSPNDPGARGRALAAGRAYARLTLNPPGQTTYTEEMIRNDLDAAGRR